MTLGLWTIVAILVGAIAVLQFVGVRALESWGVQPSRAVIVLRVINFVIVVVVVGFAMWEWVKR